MPAWVLITYAGWLPSLFPTEPLLLVVRSMHTFISECNPYSMQARHCQTPPNIGFARQNKEERVPWLLIKKCIVRYSCRDDGVFLPLFSPSC